MGIKLVIVKQLPASKIDGASMWSGDSPVVALSLRHDRMDNFWFTLIHELVHVKYEDCRQRELIDVALCGDEDDEIEERANREAANYLISSDKMSSFIARHSPRYSERQVVQFAQARQVHPSIVVGQLKTRGGLAQTHFHKLNAKVRSHVIDSAITDGW